MSRGASRKQAASRLDGVRRLLRQLAGALGVFALSLALLYGGWQLMRLPVERVVVSGELAHVSRQELQAMVSHSLQGGFLSADLEAIRSPLEALPWVHRAVVRRRWPVTLEIHVTEQFPIARWGDSGFLNHEGQVFLPEGDWPAPELPLLSGPEGSQRDLMSQYKLLQQTLQPLDLRVVSLDLNRRGGLTAHLADGCELVFGTGDLEGRLQRFLRVYQTRPQRPGQVMERVDLRYSHGVAVRWQQEELKIVGS